jgi:hypothetical protein
MVHPSTQHSFKPMQDPTPSDQFNSSPAFKTPQPAELQREESRTSVQERLTQEQDTHHPADEDVDKGQSLQTEDLEPEKPTPEEIELANLQIGIANRLAD